MSEPVAIDMDTPYTFFNPHPGFAFAGAAIPIPGPIKKVADILDGETFSLREAVARLEEIGIGRIEVVPQHTYIALWLDGGRRYATHMFRVICYR